MNEECKAERLRRLLEKALEDSWYLDVDLNGRTKLESHSYKVVTASDEREVLDALGIHR